MPLHGCADQSKVLHESYDDHEHRELGTLPMLTGTVATAVTAHFRYLGLKFKVFDLCIFSIGSLY